MGVGESSNQEKSGPDLCKKRTDPGPLLQDDAR